MILIIIIMIIILIILQFLLHIHKECLFCLPTPLEVALYATILYHTLQRIYRIQKAALSNNFLWLEEVTVLHQYIANFKFFECPFADTSRTMKQLNFYHSAPYLLLRTGPTLERTKTTLTTCE